METRPWTRGELALGLVLTAWFGAAVLAGALEVYAGLPRFGPPLVPLVLAVAGLAVYALSRPIRETILRLDITVLVSTGLLRILGLYLLVPWVYAQLPARLTLPFVIPSLVVVFGTLALMLVGVPQSERWRRWLVVWNIVGLVQLGTMFGTVVTLEMLGEMSTIRETLSGLPLILFPTFVTPLSLIVHIVIFDHMRHQASGSRATRF